MQELNVQPTNPTPYTPAGGTYNFNPTPGAGGLPALSGLSRNVNPMAQELQAQGRGQDSMLVHMTPDEVNDLQTLAMHSGTTMTINPNTGLPEAGLLGKVFKKLLPSLIGAGLMFIPGVNAIAAAGIVGGGSTLLTGSLKKGLMAGLSAYGGASLARGLGAGVQAVKSTAPLATSGGLGAKAGITAAENAYFTSLGGTAVPAVGSAASGAAAAAAPSITAAEQAFLTKAGGQFVPQAAKTGLSALPGNFAAAARDGVPKFLAKAAPMAAGLGLVNTAGGVADATRQTGPGPVNQDTWVYEGPYQPVPRTLAPRLTGPEGRGEIMYFDEPNYGGYLTASGELRGVPGAAQPQSYASQGLTGFAEGGETRVNMSPPGSTTRMLTGEEIWKMSGTEKAKPITERVSMVDYAGDVGAAKAMTEGFVNRITGTRAQFSGKDAATMKPGTIQDFSAFGGPTLRLGEDLRWYTTEAPKPTTTTRGTGTNTTTNTTTNASPTTRTATNTATTTTGTTPSGFGVYTLPDRYTPQFTKVEDFVTEKVNPYTGGTEQTNKLNEYISSYRTSPGPLKSTSMGYAPGQSPSQRNRAYAEELARQAAARQAAATATGTNTAAGSFYYNANDGGMYATPDFTGIPYTFDAVTGTFRPATSGAGGRARGGSIHMDDGAFVVDARTVSELGNGSSSAGQELLARLGGRPVKGPGDGVSDSIRANIGGRQEARVARDEVIFPAAAVKKLGGAKKLYALMDKAHKARKKAGRGSDTKLRKGLGAL